MRISVQPPPPINASKLPLQHFFDMKEYSKPFQIIFNRFLAFQRLKNPFFNQNLRFKVFFFNFPSAPIHGKMATTHQKVPQPSNQDKKRFSFRIIYFSIANASGDCVRTQENNGERRAFFLGYRSITDGVY